MNNRRNSLVTVLAIFAVGAFNASAQLETNLYSFIGFPIDGSEPSAGLVQGIDSNFYGTTEYGGASASGTVFRLIPNGSYTNLYSFGSYSNDGARPAAALVQGTDTNFYGTTLYGGASGSGTVFRISPSGTYTNLYSFGSFSKDGVVPLGGLVQGIDSNFYGTTVYGGASGSGTVFQISLSGTYTNLYSFGSFAEDGALPYARLMQGSDSNFYGTTEYGGNSDSGTVFRITASGSSGYRSLYSFGASPKDGSFPTGWLTEGGDGNFYGTTYVGGDKNKGTVFRISPNGGFTNLYMFGSFSEDGANPSAGLLQGSDDTFYGTTEYGGAYGSGIVFRISFSGSYASLYSFGGFTSDGRIPTGGLAQGSDSNFYGTTYDGGSANDGAIFELTASSVAGCTYTLGATNVTFTAKGGLKSVNVKVKGTNCAWTAVSNDPFITINSGSGGLGNGKVDYTVSGNTNTTALSGTITIAGQTFTVNQLAGGCTFKLSPKTGKIRAVGGSAIVKVSPNLSDCDWTAVSNDSFITITGSASGVGKGTVNYTVAANTNTTEMTGSITIGTETFTVTQAGAK